MISVEAGLNLDVSMPATPKLPLKLYERLGEDAMIELAGWMGEAEATHRSEFKELREADARLDARIAALEAKMVAGFAELKQQIAGVQAELIKWTFVFWLGTVGIVVLLIRFLSGNPS